MDKQPQELRRDSEVGLLDGPLRLNHSIGTLSIYLQVQGYPPLGGLSQRWLAQELGIFNNLSSVVKHGNKRGPSSINTLTA